LVMRRTASSWGVRLRRLTSAKVNNWVTSSLYHVTSPNHPSQY
jgi:hypothetical protein